MKYFTDNMFPPINTWQLEKSADGLSVGEKGGSEVINTYFATLLTYLEKKRVAVCRVSDGII